MATRNAAINFNINVGNPQALSKLNMDMNKFETSSERAGTKSSMAMDKFGNSVSEASKKSAAAAVNFQTMGQGMLNLSTAGVQTFTSFSNLDRALNRAEASVVGLQRAEDLLARKQLALDMAIEQGGKGSRKARLAADELSTAYADLAVKTDKMKIEQAAVLDVQLLFIANIANVAISSLMIYRTAFEGVTLSIIRSKISTVAHTIATKLNNFALRQSAVTATTAKISMTGLAIGIGSTTAATITLKGAVRSLLITLGPIAAVIVGISLAMQGYEENWGGMKDAINGFLGIQEEATDAIKDGTEHIYEAVDGTDTLSGSYSKLTDAMREAIDVRNEMQGAFAKQLMGESNDLSEIIALQITRMQLKDSGAGFR